MHGFETRIEQSAPRLLRAFQHTFEFFARHESATDPFAGLALLEQFAPHVAILDIGLPKIDGYGLAARIRATAAGQRCRLIALTGYGMAEDRARTRAAGFDAHLVKPVEIDALLAALRT